MPPFLLELRDRKFSVFNPPPPTEFIFNKREDWGKVGIASKGEMVIFYGAPKCRKSTILYSLISSRYTDDESLTLGFELNIGKNENILFIDTELPITSFYRRLHKLNVMCGYNAKTDMDKFHAYNLKPYSPHERIKQIENLLYEEHNNVGALIIDQVGDLVKNFNDIDEVTKVVNLLGQWTDDTGAVLILTIHVSRNTSDPTGSLGHLLTKKMDSGFYIEKNKNSKESKVVHLLARENTAPDFKFSHDDNGYPMLVKQETIDF